MGCSKSRFYCKIFEDNEVVFKGKKTGIILKKKTPEQKLKKKKINSEPEEPSINCCFDKFSISLLFYYLQYYKIPVVLHNGFFDYLYIYNTFINDLPETLEELS